MLSALQQYEQGDRRTRSIMSVWWQQEPYCSDNFPLPVQALYRPKGSNLHLRIPVNQVPEVGGLCPEGAPLLLFPHYLQTVAWGRVVVVLASGTPRYGV